jgi:hypothetical protein
MNVFCEWNWFVVCRVKVGDIISITQNDIAPPSRAKALFLTVEELGEVKGNDRHVNINADDRLTILMHVDCYIGNMEISLIQKVAEQFRLEARKEVQSLSFYTTFNRPITEIAYVYVSGR